MPKIHKNTKTPIETISEEFFPWNQAVMDELIFDYLQTLADDNSCEVLELPEYINLMELRRLIVIFKNEIEIIWKETGFGI